MTPGIPSKERTNFVVRYFNSLSYLNIIIVGKTKRNRGKLIKHLYKRRKMRGGGGKYYILLAEPCIIYSHTIVAGALSLEALV